jgi:AcrR family transcriptional regulator
MSEKPRTEPDPAPTSRIPAADRRALLVEAAMSEFAETGFAGTTTDAIARRAGISQPYVVRLFGTKKALFLASVDRCFERVVERFRTAAETAPPGRRLQAMGEAYMAELHDRERLLFQLHSYAACAEPDVRTVVQGHYRELWREVAELSGEGPGAVRAFFAMGMLCTIAAAIGVAELAEQGDAWANEVLPRPA